METMTATAAFVTAGDLEAELDAITATVSRTEVEEALASQEPPDLFVELLRNGDEQYELSVEWKRDDLERLLGETDGSEITLMSSVTIWSGPSTRMSRLMVCVSGPSY